ncbi:SAM-dependent methyltransferase [Paenibacillus psychroresistens]|uniref:SAM-dependent methyltransferase n=1 Tax=Paenibacillus psychroresistens TaxID=1778678 RepID=A0A6B8RMY1_9BACL|nr:class I SAM-dependent methyltransferase [Paenibacillus psychroresistens]QGQ96718.1 SAM-dependent methyltransferase [Paenibacillus psychroresistens]
MLVTTSYKPSNELAIKAQRIADQLGGGKYVLRRQFSLPALRKRYTETEIMLLTEREIRYYTSTDDSAIFFHPSTAAIRIKRLIRGEVDPLIAFAGISEGDSVLDCTAGLASDSIVFAYAVGATGSVVALESEPTLVMLLQEGLSCYESPIAEITEAMRRVKVEHADHYSYLQSLEAKSIDYIYFDPMFRTPVVDSSAISPLREIANMQAIQLETITEAKRVARKKIIMKELKDSTEFARLGFATTYRSQTNIAYGVIEL